MLVRHVIANLEIKEDTELKNEYSLTQKVYHNLRSDILTGAFKDKDELKEIYETGMGKIKLRGKVEVEAVKGGKERLVITEIPYTMIGNNIAKFLNDIVSLIETKKTTDIVDISNQSSKEGIRIVIELKKDASALYWSFVKVRMSKI